jgi:hypothetical protein
MELSENMSLEELGKALNKFPKLPKSEIAKFSDDWVKLLMKSTSKEKTESLYDFLTEEEIHAAIKVVSFSTMVGEQAEKDLQVMIGRGSQCKELMIFLATQFLLLILIKKFQQPGKSECIVDEILELNKELSQNISVEEWKKN